MNRLTKALVIATSLITATGLQAKPLEQQLSVGSVGATSTMQRYTFTYDFKNTVHPVVKRIKEQQQYIQYDLVTEVQQQAHGAINDIGYGVFIADYEHAPSSDWLLAK